MLTWSVCLKKCIHVKIILKKLIQTKKTKHTLSGYSLFTNSSFDATKNKLDCCKGEDCMERFCKDLREHAIKIIDYEKKEIIPLLMKKISLVKSKKFATYLKKNLILMMMMMMMMMMMVMMVTIKSIIKSEIIVITVENLEKLLIIFVI